MKSLKKQLLKKDDKVFRKYIENTTAHGVVRIFSGKSVIRKLFWLVIVLGATAGCLHNVIDRIVYLASGPTATTLSIARRNSLNFPAVTVCNLNQFQQDNLTMLHQNLSDIILAAFYTITPEAVEYCSENLEYLSYEKGVDLSNFTLPDVWQEARNIKQTFIPFCFYAGIRCNESDFTETFTESGVCYTFNSDGMESRLESNSTGIRSGLFFAVDLHVDQYVVSSTFDSGVKVSIHPQDDVPRPEDTGIAVPPGRNAFISMRQHTVADNTYGNCRRESDTSNLNFITGKPYSLSSCSYDCLLTLIATKCSCNIQAPHSNDSIYANLTVCTLNELCCVVQATRENPPCECPNSCNFTSYTLFNSYSEFPAGYARDAIQETYSLYGNNSLNLTRNLAAVSVFFESLNIEAQETNFAYGPVALLSDIGGQLGLFLGVSVISIMEFMSWILEEGKNRFFGQKLTEKRLFKSCCSKDEEKGEQESEVIANENGHGVKNAVFVEAKE